MADQCLPSQRTNSLTTSLIHQRMSRRSVLRNLTGLVLAGGSLAPFATACSSVSSGPAPVSSTNAVRFAVIGDYGSGEAKEGEIASLIKSWNPDFITTVGDNNYPRGEAATIDRNIGQFYHEFIFPYKGAYGAGATSNRFWPIYGHRDWDNVGVDRAAPLSGKPYHGYFTLPGNGRYYDFVEGSIHFFMLSTDRYRETDGTSSSSIQAKWLQSRLAASTARWKLVYAHHAPYTSAASVAGIGGSVWMRWPYAEWGATAVLAGYYHSYERILQDGIVYFVNGVSGGNYISGFTETPVEGSQVRYNQDHGAIQVNADSTHITFQFVSRTGTVVDSYTIHQ